MGLEVLVGLVATHPHIGPHAIDPRVERMSAAVDQIDDLLPGRILLGNAPSARPAQEGDRFVRVLALMLGDAGDLKVGHWIWSRCKAVRN